MGKVVGAAVTRSRLLGPAEASLMLSGGLTLLGIVVVAILFPRVVAGVLALVAAWIALTLLVQAWRLRFAKKKPVGDSAEMEQGPAMPPKSP